ncbi:MULTISPECIES: type II secretion system minor pseudopilin GspH [unclassified Pseudomonas]|uniref:type II secretion system minor pseudopilin GspH n=1 Tax=unclassified Pseudomonas TaxID=196821 RepID=UPI0028AD59EF|nr:type II secretion system minor pseudopilin GspH [Pseudomonas sp.]
MTSRRCRGFTLLELLVVLALLGVLVGMAGLTLGRDPQRQVSQEASQFLQLVQYARQRAVLEGATLGIHVDAQRYRLARRTERGWEMAGQWRDTGLDLRLELDGLPVLARLSEVPRLLLHSNDEHSVFTLHFENAGQRLASVTSDGLNDPKFGF